MKFHFDGYALCEIDPIDPEEGDPEAKLLGIFLTRTQMAPFLRDRAWSDRRREEGYAAHWMRRPRLIRRQYVVVPIAEITGKCLYDIQEDIEKTALLLARGYGKVTAAAHTCAMVAQQKDEVA